MKPRTPPRRKLASRDVIPPEVPEAAAATQSAPSDPKAEPQDIPDHIRRMLEAAYT
ncbi:MAG: hypothetical protein ABSA58_12830 [Acetobacteraceae bacterium]